MKIRHSIALATLSLALGFSGCVTTYGTGTLNLAITDTPVDGVTSVMVAFTGIDLMGPGGESEITFTGEKIVDLLTLQGNASSQLLAGVPVTAGMYSWMRFNIDPANSFVVTTSGGTLPLVVANGFQTGLQLSDFFVVPDSGTGNYAVDFDLRQSLGQANITTYSLYPALRLVDLQGSGSVSGSVSNALTINGQSITAPGCSPAVYVYQGTGVTPEGYEVVATGGTPPVSSASVTLNGGTGNYTYTVGFLPPGSYTLAATCAANDAFTQSSLAFSVTQNVTVTASGSSTLNF